MFFVYIRITYKNSVHRTDPNVYCEKNSKIDYFSYKHIFKITVLLPHILSLYIKGKKSIIINFFLAYKKTVRSQNNRLNSFLINCTMELNYNAVYTVTGCLKLYQLYSSFFYLFPSSSCESKFIKKFIKKIGPQILTLWKRSNFDSHFCLKCLRLVLIACFRHFLRLASVCHPLCLSA